MIKFFNKHLNNCQKIAHTVHEAPLLPKWFIYILKFENRSENWIIGKVVIQINSFQGSEWVAKTNTFFMKEVK